MPEIVFVILEALVRADGCGRAGVIADIAGYSEIYIRVMAPSMIKQGIMTRGDGNFSITERGKIIWAIESVRRSKRKYAPRAFTVRCYMKAA